MDREKLKHWAILLEQEMQKHRAESKDVASLYDYKELIDAIKSAKEKRIEESIELPALTYYLFETNIRDFKGLANALSGFSLLLEGLEPT